MSSFEGLIVWRRARDIAVSAYRLVRAPQASLDHAFRDQIQRAAVSIAANIAEGAERGGRREFAYFLHVAKGSAGELRSHLSIACELGFVPSDAVARLQDEVTQLILMLRALIARQQ